MGQPEVSVILFVYNEEKNLRRCLNSILAQTLQELEIICIDDGSSDRSLAILKEYEMEDERFCVLSQNRLGAGTARNAGLAIAQGKYLSFLTADTMLESDFYRTAVETLNQENGDFMLMGSDDYYLDTLTFKSDDERLNLDILPPYQPFHRRCMTGNIFHSMKDITYDKIYRRGFIQENGLQFQEQPASEELTFVYEALIFAKKIMYDREIRIHRVRLKENTLLETRERSWYCFYDALIALRRFLWEQKLLGELEQYFVNYALHCSLWNLNTLRGDSHRKVYWRLSQEWLDRLGIAGKEASYFSNRKEYFCAKEILERTYRDYPVKLSVVIPIHNGEQYLEECLDFIQYNDSTYGDAVYDDAPLPMEQRIPLEIICVDDASTDKTWKILQEYQEKYKNIHILKNKENIFAGRSRNRGLQAAKGRYIHFLDADDLVLPGAYRKLYDLAVELELDFVKTTALSMDSETYQPIADYRYSMRGLDPGYDGTMLDFHNSPRKFMRYFSVVPWNALYLRSFLQDNHILFNSLFCINDRSFFVETCMKAKRMTTARIPVVNHRYYVKNSLVSRRGVHFYCQFDSYRIMKQLCDENHVNDQVRFRVLDAELVDMLWWYFKSDEREKATWMEPIQQFLHEEVDIEWFRGREGCQWLPVYKERFGREPY